MEEAGFEPAFGVLETPIAPGLPHRSPLTRYRSLALSASSGAVRFTTSPGPSSHVCPVDNGVIKPSRSFRIAGGVVFAFRKAQKPGERRRKLYAIFTSRASVSLWITSEVPAPSHFGSGTSGVYPQVGLHASGGMRKPISAEINTEIVSPGHSAPSTSIGLVFGVSLRDRHAGPPRRRIYSVKP